MRIHYNYHEPPGKNPAPVGACPPSGQLSHFNFSGSFPTSHNAAPKPRTPSTFKSMHIHLCIRIYMYIICTFMLYIYICETDFGAESMQTLNRTYSELFGVSGKPPKCLDPYGRIVQIPAQLPASLIHQRSCIHLISAFLWSGISSAFGVYLEGIVGTAGHAGCFYDPTRFRPIAYRQLSQRSSWILPGTLK